MTIYLDGLLFLNFIVDFLLLITTSFVLKRNIAVFRIILGAFIGSISILILFLNLNTIELFIFKFILCLIMLLVTFSFRNIRYTIVNIFFFYILSIFLGGFLLMLNINTYSSNGFIFFPKSFNILLVLFIPIILYIYFLQTKFYKKNVSNYYPLELIIGDKKLSLIGFMDTGNSLLFMKKVVVITNIKDIFHQKSIFVPYVSAGDSGILKCINAKIKCELGSYDVLLNFNSNLNFFGAQVLLNNLMEGKK